MPAADLTMKGWKAALARWTLRPRSNGIPIGRATFAHVRTGDAARARRDWPAAACAYRLALAGEPHLQHVWIQLGHMEKEAGAIDRAAAAYCEAARLAPGDGEPLLHLGHMAMRWSPPIEAVAHFVAALRRAPGNKDAMAALVRLLPDRDTMPADLWAAVLEVLDIDPSDQRADAAPLTESAMLFDVTDLLAFFGRHRLPTGIQRVQIEVALACLDDAADLRPVFCLYATARRGWIRLPDDQFEQVCRSARDSDDADDPSWTDRLERLYRRIAVARTVAFPRGATLVNLGTSWSDRNHLLDVRLLRARDAVRYVPFVYDVVPLIGPQWCMDTLVRDYRAWFGSLLHSADAYLVISEATGRDLLRMAASQGVAIPADRIAVVRLDGDFRQSAAPVAAVRDYGLTPGGYVLFVSTLEPRKNHLGAFRAWLALADTLGEDAVPRLVCVGGRGWLNEALHALCRERPALGRMVVILHDVADDALAALYAHCLFTLYPSFYEGWGLPVSESLAWGKVPATSRRSSLPEAGGVFARYFDPSDPADIAATVRMLLDDEIRTALEVAIRDHYRPRSWHDIACDIVAHARAAVSRPQQTLFVLDGPGSWTLALPDMVADAAEASLSGEPLRHGRAWQAPGSDGCSIEGDDAALWFHWNGPPGATLHIRFAPTRAGGTVRIGLSDDTQDHTAAPGQALVASVRLPMVPATLWIPLQPLAGDIVAASISVTHTPLSGQQAR